MINPCINPRSLSLILGRYRKSLSSTAETLQICFRRAFRVLLAALMLIAVARTACDATDRAALQQQLRHILKQELPPGYTVSLQVVDRETGTILLEKNPDLPLIPASTMKLVTSSAALRILGPSYRFITEILATHVRGGSVRHLFIRGTGDPYLVSERMYSLCRELRAKGLEEVGGQIVVDDSYFIPGRPLDEQEELTTRSYHAPYGALSLNFNSVRIFIKPGAKIGAPALVSLDPLSDYARLRNRVRTVKGRGKARVTFDKQPMKSGGEIIRAEGTVGERARTATRYVNISEPAVYTGEVLKEFLLREGVRVTGHVVKGKTPSQAVSLIEFESLPLGVIVYWLNKFSNNFMAEQLGLALGAKVLGAPGTRAKGVAVLKKHMVTMGASESTFSITEASGLSRTNRLSASALVRLLAVTAHQFSFNAELVSSLGIAGVDGTLKDKFTGPEIKGRIRAKTGTLRGVNALAGYGLTKDGRIVVFAVIVNSLNDGAGYVDYADKIARAIMDMQLGAL